MHCIVVLTVEQKRKAYLPDSLVDTKNICVSTQAEISLNGCNGMGLFYNLQLGL